MNYKLVIFDWDGTLMDSVPKIVACIEKAALAVGLEIRAKQEIKNIIGLSLNKAMSVLYPAVSDQQRQSMIEAYREQFKVLDTTPMPFYTGAIELIKFLHNQGYLLAVATGKSRAGLDHVLQGNQLDSYFVTSRCSDEANSKPDPLMLKQILQELDIDAKDTVMVGDSCYDLEMAQAIDMDSIGISHGVHSRELLSEVGPLVVLDNIAGLYDCL